MANEVKLPPQPKPADYWDKEGAFLEVPFKQAMAAWRDVCREIVKAGESAAFWSKR